MQAIKPDVILFGDNEGRIMARSGELVGFSKTLFVWRFGFLPESDHAKAYGVHCNDGFMWALSNKNGKILDIFIGYALELPARFKKTIEKSI